MELALVAVIGGTRPPISLVEVHCWIAKHFGILGDSFQVRRYFPEDFIIVFSFLDDMLRVLHEPPTGNPSLSFVFKRWHWHLHASADELLYHITVHLWRLSAHVCNLSTASQILGSACANLLAVPPVVAKNDLSSLMVKAWCIHPDLIPREKIIFMLEPETVNIHAVLPIPVGDYSSLKTNPLL
jgi:hypothetical protein